jgi:hypothetical protein
MTICPAVIRYGDFSMDQLSRLDVPPKGAAFFLPGTRCAARPANDRDQAKENRE